MSQTQVRLHFLYGCCHRYRLIQNTKSSLAVSQERWLQEKGGKRSSYLPTTTLKCYFKMFVFTISNFTMFRDKLGALCRNRAWTLGVSVESLHITLTWIPLSSALLPGQRKCSLLPHEAIAEGISVECQPVTFCTGIVITSLQLHWICVTDIF